MTSDATFKVLSTREFDAVLLRALGRLGLSRDEARHLIDARWPIVGAGVLTELTGRGLVLSIDDVQSFLDELAAMDGGDRLDARAIAWVPATLDLLIAWAERNGRGQPTLLGHLNARHPQVVERYMRAAAAPNN